MARVLIAGCGYLGSALAARLARAGNEVVGIRRNPTSAGLFRSVAMDLAAAAELTTWLSGETGFDAVVCTVAAVARDEHSYRSAYVEALKSLQAGLRATHKIPPLFVFTSSTSVYHQDGGEWVDEETPTRPPAYRGRV
jgi:nucleoside-diphosphate-sugar epimerase